MGEKLTMTWRFKPQEIDGHFYVDEHQDGTSGFTRWGPMPPDAVGPFIDERKESLAVMVESSRAALSLSEGGK